MIDPREVRIGNKVDLFGSIATIQAADFSKNGNGIAINSGMPIPLTEEWLSKFGCESIQEFLAHFSELAKQKQGVPIDYYNDSGLSYIKSLPVHKVQNLFYELTGEELTIKE